MRKAQVTYDYVGKRSTDHRLRAVVGLPAYRATQAGEILTHDGKRLAANRILSARGARVDQAAWCFHGQGLQSRENVS